MEDEGDDKDDAKRKTRNLSEKKRRDQFNMLVTELSTLITSNNRKMDKSTVLKSAISFLKNHYEVTVQSRAHDIQEDWKPAFLSNEEFTYLVLEALEGFIMVFSASGRIYYVSESITSLLGHNPAEMVNKSIFDLIFEDDRPNLYSLLQRHATANEQMSNQSKENEMIRLQIHIRRATSDLNEAVSYDLIQFYGHFRTNQEQDDREVMDYRDVESRVLFVCIGCIHTPQLIRDVSLVDSSRNEFTSRHSLEWKFLFLDHRAPPIIGYLPFEVLGTSGYDYYHFDDLEKVVTCHEDLMQKGELTSCYYRFLTKGQQWIWLQSRFYITYHQWNSKPEFVVCTHRVVSYADVMQTTKEEKVELDATEETETNANQSSSMNDTPAKDPPLPPISPSYLSEPASDTYASYHPISQSASVKSASAGSTTGTIATAATSWGQSGTRYTGGSDGASQSGESRNSEREKPQYVAPQHAIGAQYLDPMPYGAAVAPPVLLPVATLPALVAHDHAQMQLPWQEQLQRKHEELQQMIVHQQEELRQVKEQLLLARLGILQPLLNVPSPYTQDEMQNQQRMASQLAFGSPAARPALAGYPHESMALPQLASMPAMPPLSMQPMQPMQPPNQTHQTHQQHPSQSPHPDSTQHSHMPH